MWEWAKTAWHWATGLLAKRETMRDADDARVRLNVDFVLARMRERITDQDSEIQRQGARIELLEMRAAEQAKELTQVHVERAECRAELAAIKREVEALKARG